MKQEKQTPDNAFEKALQANIQGSRHALKFISQFVSALLKTRTSNLVKIANACAAEVEPASVYRQIQRFLKNENAVAIDYLKLLNLNGKLKVLIDRTEWKFGTTWINILTLSVAYRNVAIPLLWEVVNKRANAKAGEHIEIIKRFVKQFGAESILRVYADREFGSRELLEYLIENGIDFHIRLKTHHLSGERSFQQLMGQTAEKVKLRGKVKIEVFGLQMYVSSMKYRKDGKTQYLIVASGQRNKQALEEYKTRWQIETMFGCLKSRGFNFEETHLKGPKKISKLMMMLGLGLCLALLMGVSQVEIRKRVKLKKKKHERLAKSLFRVGLDSLQNLLFNYEKPNKDKQLKLFILQLSCT